MTANEITELAGQLMRECEDSVTNGAGLSEPLEHAYHLAQAVADLLGPPTSDGDVTVEQALALRTRLSAPRCHSANVMRWPKWVGLPESYLYVECKDSGASNAFVCGIDREGRVSS